MDFISGKRSYSPFVSSLAFFWSSLCCSFQVTSLIWLQTIELKDEIQLIKWANICHNGNCGRQKYSLEWLVDFSNDSFSLTTPARTLSISGLKSGVLKLSFLSLKNIVKSGVEFVLKFTEPLQS